MEVGAVLVLLVAIVRAKANTAGVIWIPLRNENCWRGIVGSGMGIDRLVCKSAGFVAGQRLFHLHIEGCSVIHVAAVVGRQQEMPGVFSRIGCRRGVNDGGDVYASLQVLGHLHPVFGCYQDCPVPRIFGPAVRVKLVARSVHRPDPVEKLRMSPVVGSIDPGPIFHMHHIAGRNGVLHQELSDGCRYISFGSSFVGKLWNRLIIIGISPAPGVVTIVRKEHD